MYDQFENESRLSLIWCRPNRIQSSNWIHGYHQDGVDLYPNSELESHFRIITMWKHRVDSAEVCKILLVSDQRPRIWNKLFQNREYMNCIEWSIWIGLD